MRTIVQRLALVAFGVGIGWEMVTYAAPPAVEWPHRENCTGAPVQVGYAVVAYGPDKADRTSAEDTCWGDYVPAYLVRRQYPFREVLEPGETFRVPAGHHYATWVNRGALVSGDHHAPDGAILTAPEVIE